MASNGQIVATLAEQVKWLKRRPEGRRRPALVLLYLRRNRPWLANISEMPLKIDGRQSLYLSLLNRDVKMSRSRGWPRK